jgi:5'-deoxynucleotidase YfbR-like HD superfamily hydrolase
MKSLRERIQFAYEGGQVVRFHTRMGLKPITDAAHSHGVAMLCYLLWEADADTTDLGSLLAAALVHDLAEQSVGDVPAPTKWALLGLAEQLEGLEQEVLRKYSFNINLCEEERRLLRLADSLEGLLYCANELNLGNRKSIVIGNRWVDYLCSLEIPAEQLHIQKVINVIVEIWKGAVNGEAPADFTQLEQ